jgi:type IV pilus assembly protein PilE
MKHRMQGVTLIELMIVVVVLSIIAAIAIPSYRNYMLRSHRSEAMAGLLQIRTAQEKFFLQRNRYATAAELSTAPPNGLGIPATTSGGYYTLSMATDAGPPPSFVVTATPIGGQTRDVCTSFTLDSQGTRDAVPNMAACWR